MLKKILALIAMLYAVASFAAVEVNKATAAELDGIKGIGPGISTKILDERKKGNFKDWNDFIDRVKGVGEGNAAKYSTEGLTVNGDGFKGAMPAKKADKKADKAAATTTAAPATPATAEVAKADKPVKEKKAKKDKAADAPANAASGPKK